MLGGVITLQGDRFGSDEVVRFAADGRSAEEEEGEREGKGGVRS